MCRARFPKSHDFGYGSSPRPGAMLVEFAFVVVIFLMLLFGIVEYCQFLFVRQVVVNAAREGARYAVVNTTDSTMVADTTGYVKTRMAGMQNTVKNYACQVYKADSTGANVGSATDAGFGSYVAVQIDCDYDALLPALLFMNQKIHIRSKCLMFSEAN